MKRSLHTCIELEALALLLIIVARICRILCDGAATTTDYNSGIRYEFGRKIDFWGKPMLGC